MCVRRVFGGKEHFQFKFQKLFLTRFIYLETKRKHLEWLVLVVNLKSQLNPKTRTSSLFNGFSFMYLSNLTLIITLKVCDMNAAIYFDENVIVTVIEKYIFKSLQKQFGVQIFKTIIKNSQLCGHLNC